MKLEKKIERQERNRAAKAAKAEARQQAQPLDAEGGIASRGQVQNPPHLSWLNGKRAPQRLGGRKNRPGEKHLHDLAITEDMGRSLALALEKAQNPTAETVPVPVVPIDVAGTLSSI